MTTQTNFQIFCKVNPSEDIEKIKTAIYNLIPDLKIKIHNNQLSGDSGNLELLSKILNSIQRRKIKKTFLRILKLNMANDSTWFYLNKQAAFADVVVLCAEANESALGPIKIILYSNDIENTIETLISD